MIERLVAFALRHPVIVMTLTVLIVILGIVASSRLRLEVAPEAPEPHYEKPPPTPTI